MRPGIHQDVQVLGRRKGVTTSPQHSMRGHSQRLQRVPRQAHHWRRLDSEGLRARPEEAPPQAGEQELHLTHLLHPSRGERQNLRRRRAREHPRAQVQA